MAAVYTGFFGKTGVKVMGEVLVKEATIYVTKIDRERLGKLIEIARERDGEVNREYLNRLEEELERAETVEPQEVSPDVITMRSKVRLKDLRTGEEVVYSLVFPTEADFSAGKISVLAPVGTAMLGYRRGDVIEWVVPSGLRRLRVEEVLYQPESAGAYHL
jgi:regulator of nucleoside diphosphate kinase